MANPYYIGWGLMSTFAAVALYSIWRNIITHAPSAGKKDYGLAYLSGALGIWVLLSLWGLSNTHLPPPWPDTVRSLLSTVNSMLYLLAIQHFDYAYEQVRRRWWQPAVLTSAAVTAAVTLLIAWYATANSIPAEIANEWVNWPDLLFAGPAILALGIAFWRSFFFRGYKLLAWLSVAIMLLVFLIQIPDVFLEWQREPAFSALENWLTLSVYAVMTMFCFALATSWGVEEFSLPLPDQTHLAFGGRDGRRWRLHIRVREQRIEASVPPMAIKNLLLFVARRMEAPEDGWVSVDELNGGHVDFRRIVVPIAEAWQEADTGAEGSEEKTYIEKVRRTLFEYQNPGQYRIRVPLANLTFSDAFFQQSKDLVEVMRSRQERSEVEALFEKIKKWMDERAAKRQTGRM